MPVDEAFSRDAVGRQFTDVRIGGRVVRPLDTTEASG
jgi:hypothetical protein